MRPLTLYIFLFLMSPLTAHALPIIFGEEVKLKEKTLHPISVAPQKKASLTLKNGNIFLIKDNTNYFLTKPETFMPEKLLTVLWLPKTDSLYFLVHYTQGARGLAATFILVDEYGGNPCQDLFGEQDNVFPYTEFSAEDQSLYILSNSSNFSIPQ